MPVVRVDVPEGHSREKLRAVRREVEKAISRTWATSHIYVAVREMVAEPGDRSAVVTVDLRPGRGQEAERAAALYREVLQVLRSMLNTDPERLVLLVREFPERCFVVDGGTRLPPLVELTPQLP